MVSLESLHGANSNEYTQCTIIKVCCVFSLEPPHRGDSNEYTQYTINFQYKKKIALNYRKSTAIGYFPRDSRTTSK